MLPGMTAEKSAALKEHLGHNKLYNFASMEVNERKQAMDAIESTEDFEECEKVLNSIPIVTIKMDAFVEGDDECCVGDVLTVKIRVDLKRLKENQ